MSRFAPVFVLLLASQLAFAADIESDKDKLSYALGYQAGFDFKNRNLDINTTLVEKGLRDALAQKDPGVAKDEMARVLTELQKKLRDQQLAQLKALADQNLAKGEKFLAENGTKKGIVTLPSGVQYRVIESGTGAKPKMSDTVLLHYRGSLLEGLEFDSSFARGVPNRFVVNEVLAGWQEVLPLMKVGAEWKIYLPPELGYGLRAPRPIGPNEVLVFDMKLMEINPPENK